MGRPVAVLLLPAEAHAEALLAPSPGGARPPTAAWDQRERVVTSIKYSGRYGSVTALVLAATDVRDWLGTARLHDVVSRAREDDEPTDCPQRLVPYIEPIWGESDDGDWLRILGVTLYRSCVAWRVEFDEPIEPPRALGEDLFEAWADAAIAQELGYGTVLVIDDAGREVRLA